MWEQKNLYDRIKMRLDQKERQYQRFNSARDEIVKQFRPDLGIDTNNAGEFFGDEIYEGTAPWAIRVMATGFQGNLVSKSIDWLLYKMKQDNLNGVDQIDIWLQAVKEHMSSVYRRSNFYDVQPLFTLDSLSIGSPIMFAEEDDVLTGRIVFRQVHYKHVYQCYDKDNRSYGVIVKDPTWTAYDIATRFSSKEEREKTLSRKLNMALRNGEYYQEFTMLRAVFPADDDIWEAEGFKKPEGDFKYYSVWFEDETDTDRRKEPLRVEGYMSKPYTGWDYDKKPWEPVSRTPAYDAIYDVWSLQEVRKAHIENVQQSSRRNLMVYDTMLNKLELGPEGLTPVNADEYNHPPKPIENIGDINWTKDLTEELKDAVRRHCHLDLFQMFTNIAQTKKQPLTATQIWQMAGEKSTLLSPAVETHSRYLADVDERVMGIEIRAGRGPFSPNEVANILDVIFSQSKGPVNSIGVVPEFIGPLARAQRTQQALDTIQSGLSAASPMFQLFPDLVHAIREYDTLDDILTATNFPQKDIKTKDEYNAITEQLNAARQQAAQQQQMIDMMKASKMNVQKNIEPDSVIGQAQEAMNG